MKGFIRFINRYLFGIYEENYEYWIKIDNIKLPHYMVGSRIGKEKYKRKWKDFRKNGELESKIILDQDCFLIDGYSSFVIAKKAGLEKVPVYFIDSTKRGEIPS